MSMRRCIIIFIALICSIAIYCQTKENDYLVAKCENPSFGASNFQASGLTPSNTQFMPKEWYEPKTYVRKKFSPKGYFDKDLFNRFYAALSREWYRFCNYSEENNAIIEMSYTSYDTLRPTQHKSIRINGCTFWELPAYR